MKYKVSILSLIALIFLLSFNSTAEEFNKFKGAIELFPNHIEKEGEYIGPTNEEPVEFRYKVDVDKEAKEISYIAQSPLSKRTSSLDSYLMPIRTEMRFNSKYQELLKLHGYEQRVSKFDSKKKQMVVSLYKEEKEQDKFIVNYENETIDADNIFLYLQAYLLMEKRDDFQIDMLANERGKTVKMDFNLIQSNKLQGISSEYDLPKGLLEIIGGIDKFYIFEMKLSGFLGLIWRTKYYCLFEYQQPYNFVAYWGGSEGKEEFIYCR
ncbi:hypothetical protein BX659_11455 [Orenia metallireducens]|jgi:hypothetical protein|uniref:Uncharacterized protein n=1 Tax=Orenia metallireducens TaxID=1413210 RepID=A0A285HNM1_9FIRM|nr:hypothetical protein [Orenia metallireducens]PRX28005.1 hypothetical protein BX659_11455 [Orenia metallireducens]SNY37330.1 hypothetical protein SAMN06265827_1225 [Orenia metallireducens]